MGDLKRYKTIAKDEIESCLKALVKCKDLDRVILRGYKIVVDTDRYENLYYHKCKCAKCGLEASFAAIEKNKHSKDKFHLNIYGIDKNGKEICLTKDHIYPRSLGGFDALDNYQVLCEKCNKLKGDTTEMSAEEAIAAGYTCQEAVDIVKELDLKRKELNRLEVIAGQRRTEIRQLHSKLNLYVPTKRDKKELI